MSAVFLPNLSEIFPQKVELTIIPKIKKYLKKMDICLCVWVFRKISKTTEQTRESLTISGGGGIYVNSLL